MIKKSFVFLNRVDEKKERNIWHQGIRNWNDFTKTKTIKGLSKKTKKNCDLQIKEASVALRNGDSSFFSQNLKTKYAWRLYDHFKEESCFLDIETTGVKTTDEVIAIGIFDGIKTKTMIKGINLDRKKISRELKKYKIIITFNGLSFDIPFLKKRFKNTIPHLPHIDLKHTCQKIGLKNGLKEIEKTLSISRDPIITKMRGGDAYRLWRMYFASGDKHYLNLLIEYNEEDIINLKKIADYTIKKIQEEFLLKNKT